MLTRIPDPFASMRLSGPVRGALWMIVGAASFAVTGASVRAVSQGFSPIEVVFWRSLFGAFLMATSLWGSGLGGLRTKRFGMHFLRALSAMAAMTTLFAAFKLLPVAEVTALCFTMPLFVTAGAALFMGEKVSVRRGTAIAIGFVGALIVIRPGGGTFSLEGLVALASAAFMASSMLLVKSLARTERASTVVLYMMILTTPMSLVPSLFVWRTPQGVEWLLLFAVAASASLTQITMAKALQAAEVTAILPFDFSKLIFASLLAYVAFGEVAGIWTWVGGGLIFSASLYTAHREARAARIARAKDVTPPPNP